MRRKSIVNTFGKISLVTTLLLSSTILTNQLARAEGNMTDSIEMKKIAGYSIGVTDEDGGVAEIVKYNSDNKKFYVINGKGHTIDIVSLESLSSSNTVQTLEKEKSIDIAKAVNTATFTYGDVTSIDINTTKDIIVAAVQDVEYTKNGKIIVMNYDGDIQKTFDVGVQPDMVKITSDGKTILSANEGEPRNGLVNGVDPEGSVSIIDIENDNITNVKFDDESVIADDVHIRNNGTKANAVTDFEPEYIAVSEKAGKAYVTLQENNAIATIDYKAGKTIAVNSLGYKDHTLTGNELDAARNDKIEIESLPILGSYMPDSVEYVSIRGNDYLITANEGDATEWEEFVNVADLKKVKGSIVPNASLFKGMPEAEVQAAYNRMLNTKDFEKLEVLTDRGNDAIYTLGGRSFSIWNANTMELVYDSGSDLERITAERFPDVFNWSNDDNVFEKRSAKKGPEPEDVKVGIIGNDVYAFIGLERIGGVMTYNISNPENAEFANYLNTRDFSATIAGDVAPEGLAFVSAEESPTGRPLVLVGNEVSGTVSVNEVQVDPIKRIEAISLNQTEVNLEVDKTITLKASVHPTDTTDNKELVWSSSNEKIASVTNEGVVTALAAGEATIMVQTKDGKNSATAKVVVNESVSPAPTPALSPKESPSPIPDQVDNNYGQNTDVKNETNSTQNGNYKLPDTATNSYNLIVIGLLLIVLSAIALIVKRKSTIEE
ncbi:choice-of-anchor I family protein [Neobacillus niacini]|uniref:choice-of-anchor I family protein n=1 Tax=Neobacillus niacini TaxID=86668 RepID=UPI0007AB7631|nr:choice-of-anchor I family protein [Neobacillus niacini]MEC1523798.1 choice-of-anchor I family protein [Neobacillus niacini]